MVIGARGCGRRHLYNLITSMLQRLFKADTHNTQTTKTFPTINDIETVVSMSIPSSRHLQIHPVSSTARMHD